jgi:dGTPase
MDNNDWLSRRFTSLAKRQQDHRSPFQRDRARILHSAAFRRLQSKTQVMGSGQSDFYRTRLTHSLEASQIGSGIVAQLRSKYPQLAKSLLTENDALIESLCLAHDIGHPPFGHGGEVALNYMMDAFGGFEGNGQTLRIVARLEPYTELYGMNLCRRTLLGLIKYPQIIDKLKSYRHPSPVNFRQLKASEWHPPKGIYKDDESILDWILAPLSPQDRQQFQSMANKDKGHHKTCFKSLDCSMMELADDIAYGIHDLEDAIVTGIVSRDSFEAEVVAPLKQIDNMRIQSTAAQLANKLFSDKHYLQKDAIGDLVNYLITAIELVDLNETQGSHFQEALLRYNAQLPEQAYKALKIFKKFVLNYVIKQPSLQRLEYKGQQIVMELFEAFASDPLRLLPKEIAQQWHNNSQANPTRIIADYIASMTDECAIRVYNSMFYSAKL